MNVKSLAGGPFLSVLTDFNGRFEVRGLPPGTYEVSAEEPGYESTQATAQLEGTAPELVLYLKPPGTPAGSQTRTTISVRELKIPATALRAFEKGLERLGKNDLAGSLGHFAKAAKAFPGYYEAYYNMAVANMRMGRKDEAMDAFQKAIDLSAGRYAKAEFGLGALLWEEGKPREAEAIIRRGLELDTASPTGRLYLGMALLALDRLEEAERSVREALLGKPDFARAYTVLADVHGRKRDYGAEVQDLDAYLKLEPTGAESDRIRKIRDAAQRCAAKPAAKKYLLWALNWRW